MAPAGRCWPLSGTARAWCRRQRVPPPTAAASCAPGGAAAPHLTILLMCYPLLPAAARKESEPGCGPPFARACRLPTMLCPSEAVNRPVCCLQSQFSMNMLFSYTRDHLSSLASSSDCNLAALQALQARCMMMSTEDCALVPVPPPWGWDRSAAAAAAPAAPKAEAPPCSLADQCNGLHELHTQVQRGDAQVKMASYYGIGARLRTTQVNCRQRSTLNARRSTLSRGKDGVTHTGRTHMRIGEEITTWIALESVKSVCCLTQYQRVHRQEAGSLLASWPASGPSLRGWAAHAPPAARLAPPGSWAPAALRPPGPWSPCSAAAPQTRRIRRCLAAWRR